MILPYFIIIPLLAAFLITLINGKKDDWAIALSSIALLSLTILSFYAFFAMQEGVAVYTMSGWRLPFGIALVQDSLTAFMLVVVSVIALLSLLYSIQYIRHLGKDWKYYALYMVLVTGMNGVIITGDLFNLFVFMEIALLAAFALVAFGGRAEEFEASFKYAVMGALSSTLILLGIAVTYSATSTLTLAKIGEQLATVQSDVVMWIGGIFLAGFGLKAAIVPFHAWLPDAHSSAPAPISSMLSGVLIKVLGIYALIRLFFNVLGAPQVFLTAFVVLGIISILVGGFLSIRQWDLKRLLAYSSVSQVGYILFGLGLATPLGILGAVFHLLNHAIFKALLFYNAGAVELELGSRDLRDMQKNPKRMPVTSETSLLGSLAISGIPPLNGFFSKLILIIAAIQAGFPVYALLAIAGSVLTLIALMRAQRYGFRAPKDHKDVTSAVGWSMKFSMIVLAVFCVLTSLLLIPGVREVTLDPVVNVIINKSQYIHLVLGSSL